MIESCLNCTREHLGKAHGYLLESLTGRYPARFWKCIGQMSLAFEESYRSYPEVAKIIDSEKRKMIEDEDYLTDFDPLIDMVTSIANKEYEVLSNNNKTLTPIKEENIND